MKIAITGGIACGKSLLSQYLNAHGIATIDADDVVHELLPDPAERKRIAAEVFADPIKRKGLEARLHPQVKSRILQAIAGGQTPTSDGGQTLAVVPLLYEVGWDRDFDRVACITSSRETQIARMISSRGYTRAEAEARLAAQMPVTEKASRADYVIENDGSAEDLRKAADLFVEWLNNEVNSGSVPKK